MCKRKKPQGKLSLLSKSIRKTCSVLKIIDIPLFFHIRVTVENKFFILSNEYSITEFCMLQKASIGTFLEEAIVNSIKGKISIHLWPSTKTDLLLDKLYALNIENGISMVLRFGEYVDAFSFAVDGRNKDVSNFYINHIGLLKRFVIYFRIKNKGIIDDVACNYMIALKNPIDLKKEVKNELLEELRCFRKKILPQQVLIDEIGDKKLTRKETEYLSLMFEGNSMKKIANKLKVSPRTVETILQRIKWKTGCNTKASLLLFFLKKQIYKVNVIYERYN